jgi:NAD(P)-dependent dehydrogenase (short-subunit alcohol dehydrogenase family)
MKEFKDKVAVITGAASGIGYGLAERAAKEGMKVVLADVEESALVKAEKDIRALGADTLAVKTDVSKADDVKALADKTMEAFGAVQLLCNNAGVSAGSTAWASTLSDWKWVLGVNLWGVIHGIHYFLPIMIKQDCECHIVSTSSMAGLITHTGNGPYAVSKHGVVALSETLYHELRQGRYNIGVSVVCPGWIKTNIMEAERNRPGELQNKPGEGIDITDPEIQDVFRSAAQSVENGMSPQQLAEIVFGAIRDNIFYIFPNGEEFLPMIQTRSNNILLQRNPSLEPQSE